jgi:hypothetical protein
MLAFRSVQQGNYCGLYATKRGERLRSLAVW